MNMLRTLFDAYLIVDWSAASRPKRGRDSIWHCLLERGREPVLENPATRHEVAQKIEGMLLDLIQRRRSVLVGFDFPYGYPCGLSRALGLEPLGLDPLGLGPAPEKPWRLIWQDWSRRVEDHDDNQNNRFEVAARLNEQLSSGPGPFWGCPRSEAKPCLSPKKPSSSGIAERRLVEECDKRTQPVWKLAYPGSVGSQALLGIPRLEHLISHPKLRSVSRVWPFGWDATVKEDLYRRKLLVLHAEVYPSLLRTEPTEGEVKDATQVRCLAQYFAQKDEAGELADLLDAPLRLPEDQRRRVIDEEGWILGVLCPSGNGGC